MSTLTGEQLGQYTLEKRLSSPGGMAQIFLAKDTRNPNLKAAIKIQLANNDNRSVYQDLLNQEVEVLRVLRHPSIVHLYPLEIDGCIHRIARAAQLTHKPWYFAMQYLGPFTLADHLKKISDLPLEWGIELFYQILITIDYMHQKGYAHCDLKPPNIFLRYPPEPSFYPMPILADFGSATRITEGIHQLTASLRYSPPEVLLAMERHDVNWDHIQPDKVDIWALGAILFEIVTGRPLVKARQRQEITTTIIRGEFDQIANQRRDKHPGLQSLDKVIARMISQDPDQRPPIAHIIRAIDEHIASVRPPRIPFA